MNRINLKRIIDSFKNPWVLGDLVLNYFAPLVKNDITFLKLKYYFIFHKKLNLDNPQSYNEKLQWLKVNCRNSDYTQMVDKIEAKKHVANIIGNDYIIPTLGIYNSFDDIDFAKLPNKFVIKCTHDSGGVVVCKDKNNLDIKTTKKIIEHGLGKSAFWASREYPYKEVKPRIIIEEYMEDESGYELKDYKIFCFNGKAKFLFVATDRGKENEETKFDFYDLDWNHLPLTNGHPNSLKQIEKPKNLDEMVIISEKLSNGIPHVRVDLYNINGKIYFGELTFFHWSGFVPFVPDCWDYKFGDYIELPKL